MREENGVSWIAGDDGEEYFRGGRIWSGYLKHWCGRRIHARLLDKCEYESGKPIILIWPAEEKKQGDFFELYYNERLVKYPASICGHNAINVSGKIYNFSHLINENEIITPEEYFYRPALGEFAPSPVTGRFDISDPLHPYYDKFGRIFMRAIHVLRVDDIDAERLTSILMNKVDHIVNLTPDPAKPQKNPEFHWYKKNCTTNIADALSEYGLNISGIFPRDLFVSACYSCLKEYEKEKVQIFTMPQLFVDEAPRGRITPMINPVNYIKAVLLKFKY